MDNLADTEANRYSTTHSVHSLRFTCNEVNFIVGRKAPLTVMNHTEEIVTLIFSFKRLLGLCNWISKAH